jgi:hypothetical protein
MARFRVPTEAQVQEVLRRILTPQLRRAFFENLKNPLWVEPLARARVFDDPPEPEVTEDGLIRDIYWPEMDYLIRVAQQAPGPVVDVLLGLAQSKNAWVRRGVFTIGASIPATEAVRLQPLLRAWAPGAFGWRTDPREMVGVVTNLLNGGQREAGRWLANVLFRPRKGQERRKPHLVLEHYWYADALPNVVQALGADGLELVVSWLEAYERHSGLFGGGTDVTSMSREAIRKTSDSYDQVEQGLIDAVRDLAVRALPRDAEQVTALLLATDMAIARKIALFSLAEALRQSPTQEHLPELLRVARDLLADGNSMDPLCRIEYAELARAVAEQSGAPFDRLPELLNAAAQRDSARFREWQTEDVDGGQTIDQRVEGFRERWWHRWLSAIGTSALPESMQVKLAELDRALGVIESPLEPQDRIISWTGPNSPLSHDEMSNMTAPELVAHLESWRVAGDGWGPEPTHEGQARELTALLTSHPAAVSGVEGLVERLRPTYLRAILRGWEAAIRAGLAPDWSQVTEVVREVLIHDDASRFPPDGGQFDDDHDFRGAKRAAIELLEEIAKQHKDLDIPGRVTAAAAAMLVALADDEKAWLEYIAYEGENSMDPLTVSLNWQWPIRLRGLTHLLSWGRQAPWYSVTQAALERELMREDTRGASRAVLGEAVGRLLTVDPKWVEGAAPDWFGGASGINDSQQVALTTALAVHRYHPALYSLLSAAMIAAVQVQTPLTAGWRTTSDPLQRIGEWVVEAIVRGDKTVEDPVADRFFAVAPSSVRGQAVGHMAWTFMHAERVDDSIRDRLGQLWDARVEHVRSHLEDREELRNFFWFVRSGKFPAEWWLPRLKEAAEIDSGLAGETYMIGKQIATAADVDPRGALEVLQLLLDAPSEAGRSVFDLTRNAVPMVIARAIASGDETLKADAEAYMNRLGEQGHLSLMAEVEAVINGSVTQADIEE